MPAQRSIATLIFCGALVAAATLGASQRPGVVGASTQEGARNRIDGIRIISVVGSASDSVTPDAASLTVGATTQGTTARQALDANNVTMTALLEAIKRKGVAARDIQTGDLNLVTIHDRPLNEEPKRPADAPPKIIGYRIDNKVNVTIRDVSKVGEILDAAVTAGVNEIEDLSFNVSDPRTVLRDLRKKALADAREKAEEVAKEAGMTLGLPVSILVDDSPSQSYAFEARSNIVASKAAAVPISAGEELLSVSVHVEYELKMAK